MASDMAIRLATPSDVDALLLVEEDSFPPSARASGQEIFNRIITFPYGQFIAVEGSAIVGVIYTRRVGDIDKMKTELENGITSPFSSTDLHGNYVQIVAINVPVIWNDNYEDYEQRNNIKNNLVTHTLRELAMDRTIRKVVTITGFSGAFNRWEDTIITSKDVDSPKVYVLEGVLVSSNCDDDEDEFPVSRKDDRSNDDMRQFSSYDCLKHNYEVQFHMYHGAKVITSNRSENLSREISSTDFVLLEYDFSNGHGGGFSTTFDIFLFHIDTIVEKSMKQLLEICDFSGLGEDYFQVICSESLSDEWSKQTVKPISQRSLFQSIRNSMNQCYFLFGILCFFLSVCCRYIGPITLMILLTNLEKNTTDDHAPYIWQWVCCSLLADVTGTIAASQSMLMSIRFGLQIRNSIMSLVFQKIMRMHPTTRQINMGKINNMLISDAQEFQDCLWKLMPCFFAPIDIVISIYLLYLEMDVAIFVIIGYVVAIFVLTTMVIIKFSELTKEKLSATDSRIYASTEIFTNIKLLKYYAWETFFGTKLQTLRKNEVKYVEKMHTCTAMTFGLLDSIVRIGAVLILYTYLQLGHSMTASKGLALITLLTYMYASIVMIPEGMGVVSGVLNAATRIQDFLNEKDLVSYVQVTSAQSMSSPKIAIDMQNIRFDWSLMEKKIEEEFVLDDEEGKHDANIDDIARGDDRHRPVFSLHIPCGKLVAIAGPVGCGKSTLLKGLLGELNCTSGSLHVNGSISYHQQQPWIMSSTIQDNIVFDLPFDQSKFDAVLEASALLYDIDTFPSGLQTVITERGTNLSGGQKARISFARALYRDADIVLLDDPLSAVDSTVCEKMFQKGIKEYLINNNKTVLLVTHQVHLLSECDLVIMLNKDGSLLSYTTFHDLDIEHAKILLHVDNFEDGECEDNQQDGDEIIMDLSEEVTNSGNQLSTSIIRHSNSTTVLREERKAGIVSHDVFLSFLHTGGYGLFMLYILLRSLAQLASVYTFFTNSLWNHGTDEVSLMENTIILQRCSIACILDLVASLIANRVIIRHGRNVSRIIHNQLLEHLLQAPLRFFGSTPLGRIINRLTNDLQVIDIDMLIVFMLMVPLILEFITSIIIISIATLGFYLLILFSLGVICYVSTLRFRVAATQARRLEETSKSPVLDGISAYLYGATSLQAFKASPLFIQRIEDNLDTLSLVTWVRFKLIAWILVRLDILVAISNFIVFAFAIIGGSWVQKDLLLVALSRCLLNTLILKVIILQLAEYEIYLSAMERVDGYAKIPCECDHHDVSDKNNYDWLADWPNEGVVEASHLKLRYGDGPVVLNDLNFKIESGEKVGIVGRTGSGKSSLVASLFRIEPLLEGVIKIDGIDITRIPLSILRSRLCIIPQDPVLFCDKIRANLDPLRIYTDEQLWAVLEDVGLKEYVRKLPEGLDYYFSGDEEVSTGQRQLLCFARALLKDPKIIVLDEATAAADNLTDSRIQSLLKRRLENATVLTIAHRLHTIKDSDRIFVFEGGHLVEDYRPSGSTNYDASSPTSFVSANPPSESIFTKLMSNYESSHRRSVKEYRKSLKAKRQ